MCVCVVCAGLNDLDVEGEWLVQRQVLWKVPGELLQSRAGHKSRSRREQWSLFPDGEQEEVRDRQTDSPSFSISLECCPV